MRYSPNLQNAPQFAPQTGDPSAILVRLEQESQAIDQDIGKLRIDKWKADPASKQQADANAASIQRNLTNALPGMIQQVRMTPQSLAANFKLYRNLSAVYDVLASLAESAGAFGGKSEYQALGSHVGAIDDLRRSYADLLESMAAQQDAQLTAARAAASAPVNTNAAPKKIVIDDTPAPVKKTTKKKKTPSPTPQKPPSQ